MEDREILRGLAGRYADAAFSNFNLEHILLHRQVNDLVPTRPIVLIEELPWDELNADGELTIHCQDPDCRDIEAFFRTNLYKWVHMRADMVLIPYVPIHKVFSVTDYGIIWQAEERVEDVPDKAQTVKYVDQMEPFGLVYYGCCEALDRKIDILRQIPHLRKISIFPWADIDVAADAIAGDYVIASKPNPAFVAVDTLDEAAVRGEIRRIVEACRRNQISTEVLIQTSVLLLML